jgi:hypothetical protein
LENGEWRLDPETRGGKEELLGLKRTVRVEKRRPDTRTGNGRAGDGTWWCGNGNFHHATRTLNCKRSCSVAMKDQSLQKRGCPGGYGDGQMDMEMAGRVSETAGATRGQPGGEWVVCNGHEH